MSNRSSLPAALGGAVLWLLATTNALAIGTTYGATFQGTASGVDTLGIFGAKNATLQNVPYSEMFLINTLDGDRRISSSQQDEYGTNSGFVTTSLTIGGKTVTVSSSIYGEAFVNDGGAVGASSTGIKYTAGYNGGDDYHVIYDYAAGETSVKGNYVGMVGSFAENPNAAFSGFPTALDQSFSTAVGANGTTGAGYFSLYTDCWDQVEALSLKETISAAPEPSAWLFLLGGVGALGLALRRTRQARALNTPL